MSANRSILIIDDDQALLDGLRRRLAGRFDITTARSGAEGIATAGSAGPFAIVLCDMRMEGMDGVETLQRFAEDHPDTIRIMLTGNVDQTTAVEAVNRGRVFRFLNKPIAAGSLQDGLEAALSLHGKVVEERALQRQAHFDPLTGLPNRTLLVDRLTQAMAQTRRLGTVLALLFVDLDGFKLVNDRHGHEVGDQLLVGLAGRLSAVLRQGDSLARIGGDEFVAMLPHVDGEKDVVPVIDRLLKASAEPFMLPAHRVQVSASVGCALFPRDAETAGDLLKMADRAMYDAKRSGKNRYSMA